MLGTCKTYGPSCPTCHPALLPAESLALTLGLAQVQRGDEVTSHVAAVCVYALARLVGRYDYTTAVSTNAENHRIGKADTP